jgi:APA family basic amino acid/polyamine antiporter
MANEIQDKKKITKALIMAMIICGVIITLFLLSSYGTVTYKDYVQDARPWAVQALNNLGQTGQTIVVFGMYLVIIGAAAAWPITGSRLVRALAKDGLFIKKFSKLHPKHNSPYRAVYFQTVVVGLFTWVIFRGYTKGWGDPYRTMYLIFVLLSLVVVSLVLFAVPILRKKEANLERGYKAPLPWLGPILIVGLFVFLIINWVWLEYKTALN